MIYFIHGTDNFRINQRIKELRAGNPDADYQTLNAKGLSFVDFNNVVSTQSLLSPHKIVVVEDIVSEGSEELRKEVVSWLDKNVFGEIMIIFREDGEPDRRTTLFKRLNKSITEQYNKLKPVQAKQWLKEQSNNLNLQLTPEASEVLLRDFSNDLWRLTKETEKLSMFSEGQVIDKAMINKLVPQMLDDNIFDTMDALAKKNIKLANKLINTQLALGMNEQHLLTMIAYQFRNMVLIKSLTEQGIGEGKLASVAQLHPYVVQKTKSFIKDFSTLKLSKIFSILHKVDVAIKSGKTPPQVGLDILTAQIISG